MSTTTGAGLEGVIAGESEICYIDGFAGILSYRGYNIHTLAEHATFEETIYLLWHGKLPTRAELDVLKKSLAAKREIPAEVTAFLKQAGKYPPMDVLRTAVSMLGVYDPKAADTSIEASVEKAEYLMSQTATIVTSFDRMRKGLAVVFSTSEVGECLSVAHRIIVMRRGRISAQFGAGATKEMIMAASGEAVPV